jgi:hypothetical protein
MFQHCYLFFVGEVGKGRFTESGVWEAASLFCKIRLAG